MADRQESIDKGAAGPAIHTARDVATPARGHGEGLADVPSVLPDETVGSTIDRLGGDSVPDIGPRPTTGTIGDATAGPIHSGEAGGSGTLDKRGNIDTAAPQPIGIPGVGNLDPAGTGNAGVTGVGTGDTALDEAREQSSAGNVPMPEGQPGQKAA